MTQSISGGLHQYSFDKLKFQVDRFFETDFKCFRWNDYKWRTIQHQLQDEKFVARFLSLEQLPFNFGKYLDERLVEYCALFCVLSGLEPGRILDAGSTANFDKILSLPAMARHKLSIMTLANEGKASSKDVDYVYGDLCDIPFKADLFDFVFSISTIEHIGMDNTILYTTDQSYRIGHEDAYLQAVLEMRRVLKPGGKCLITVPFGSRLNLGWLQIFDRQMVENVIAAFKPSEVKCYWYAHAENGWKKVLESGSIENALFSSPIVDQSRGNFDPKRPGALGLAVLLLES